MAITPAVLAESQLTATAAVYYISSGVTTLIDRSTLCNTTGSAVVVTLYLVPTGSSPGAANTINSARSVAAGETYTCPEVEGHILESGDSIQGFGLSVTLRASGRQVSGL